MVVSLEPVSPPALSSPLPAEHPSGTALMNGSAPHESLRGEKDARQNGHEEAEAGEDGNDQEVIVIQDTGFTVKICAPGIEPFSLQVPASGREGTGRGETAGAARQGGTAPRLSPWDSGLSTGEVAFPLLGCSEGGRCKHGFWARLQKGKPLACSERLAQCTSWLRWVWHGNTCSHCLGSSGTSGAHRAMQPPLPSPHPSPSFPCPLLPFPPRELCWMQHGITWAATRAARSGQALTCLADTLI